MLGWRPSGDIGPDTVYTSTRGEIVWFPRAPPLNPPTQSQTNQRKEMTRAAKAWRTLTPAQRENWEAATHRCSLKLTGYNLYCFASITGNLEVIATIAHQARLVLDGVELPAIPHPHEQPWLYARRPNPNDYPADPVW